MARKIKRPGKGPGKGSVKGPGKGSKKGSGGNEWADHLTQRAKAENYPARSVYKLEEIQKKFKVIAPGSMVLDLGCAPGSWAKFAAELTGAEGQVIGIDLKKVSERFAANTRVIIGDVLELAQKDKENLAEIIGTGYHAVLSDMAPSTTGRKDVDAARSYYLCMAALAIAQKALEPGGCFVCKIFQGEDFEEFKDLNEEEVTCKIKEKYKKMEKYYIKNVEELYTHSEISIINGTSKIDSVNV